MHRIRFLRVVSLTGLAVALGACSGGASASPPSTESFSPVTTLPSVTNVTTTPSTTTLALSTTVQETATTTTTTLPAAERRTRLVISGIGDVNLDPTFVRSFPSQGYEYAWSGLDGVLNQDDLTVANLECSASDLG